MTVRLDYEAVITINHAITGDCVVRDVGALDSALNRPFQSAFGEDAYPTVIEKAAALLHGIATAHAFKDGNKRTAWTSCVTFLDLHGVNLEDDGTAGEFVLDLVEHRATVAGAALWLNARAS